MKNTLTIADLFCGAGGTSTGAVQAAEQLGMRVSLTAVNHWDRAVETHSRNHPTARHRCASVDSLNPRELFREGELDLLWGSPECTHHSRARGGRPMLDQSRATAVFRNSRKPCECGAADARWHQRENEQAWWQCPLCHASRTHDFNRLTHDQCVELALRMEKRNDIDGYRKLTRFYWLKFNRSLTAP